MWDWVRDNNDLLGWLGALSAITFLGTLIAVPLLISRMPADFFVREQPSGDSWAGRHPAVRFLLLAAKNALGWLLIVAGFAMLVLPGQGILTMFIGLLLVDFPGKRALELALIERPRVHRAIDWIRRKAGRLPLELPDHSSDESSS